MKQKVVMLAAFIAAAVAVAGWYRTGVEVRQLRMSELKPIAALLKDDQELLAALQTDSGSERASDILASYLAKIRADGLPKHADFKQRLDQLAENNSAIVALIDVYLPHAKTAAFKSETDKFRHYAIAWRDRWNSVMEFFMAGGNYPAAGVPFPGDFSEALSKEIAAAD